MTGYRVVRVGAGKNGRFYLAHSLVAVDQRNEFNVQPLRDVHVGGKYRVVDDFTGCLLRQTRFDCSFVPESDAEFPAAEIEIVRQLVRYHRRFRFGFGLHYTAAVLSCGSRRRRRFGILPAGGEGRREHKRRDKQRCQSLYSVHSLSPLISFYTDIISHFTGNCNTFRRYLH